MLVLVANTSPSYTKQAWMAAVNWGKGIRVLSEAEKHVCACTHRDTKTWEHTHRSTQVLHKGKEESRVVWRGAGRTMMRRTTASGKSAHRARRSRSMSRGRSPTTTGGGGGGGGACLEDLEGVDEDEEAAAPSVCVEGGLCQPPVP